MDKVDKVQELGPLTVTLSDKRQGGEKLAKQNIRKHKADVSVGFVVKLGNHDA